jgi:hypothetical protein
MSAYSPPSYVVTIYNPSYFATGSTSSGLSITQANALYLQKTTTDSATALETFISGIATNAIQTTTATSDLSIYPAQTSGNLYIGVNSTSSTGRTGTIHIGDGNNMPAGATVHINNGTTNACNTNIMNGATTSGICNIMTGATTSGTVNILTGTGASQTGTVNIASGTTTSAVTIGNSANTVNVNGSLTLAKPLVLGSTPSLDTQIGNVTSIFTATIIAASTTSSINLATLSIPSAGSWRLDAYARAGAAVASSISFSDTSATFENYRATTVSASYWMNLTYSFTCSGAVTKYLVAYPVGSASNFTYIEVRLTRTG